MVSFPKSQRGFTLAEIIIVFALIALISTYMMGSSFIAARQRARDAARKSDLVAIAKILEMYINDHNVYPESNTLPFGSAFTDGTTTYHAKLPQDIHAPSRTYVYRANSDGNAWQLFARLEREDDPSLDHNQDGSYTSDDDFDISCGTQNCNYAVTSTNTTSDTIFD